MRLRVVYKVILGRFVYLISLVKFLIEVLMIFVEIMYENMENYLSFNVKILDLKKKFEILYIYYFKVYVVLIGMCW